MIETSSVLPRKSSAILGNLRQSSVIFRNFRKMFGNVRATFGQILENLRKSSESGRKSSENRQLHRHLYVYTAVSTKVVPQKCKSVRDNADWYYG